MDQSDMVMIPNTPTLVAEENVHHKRYASTKNLAQAAQESVALDQIGAPAPMPSRQRGPAIKEPRKNESSPSKDRLPEVGEYFDNDKGDRFIFRQKLGDGAMGHVFLSVHGGRTVAIKTEKHSTGMLPMEIKVLMMVKRNKGKHFCDLIDYGALRREYNYMVISLLGKDLYRLRAEMPTRSFSLNTTTKIALETLEAIEDLHSVGYLSRDVKPSNFAPGIREQGQHKTIFMFDFGLAKKFLDRDNRKIKSRGEVGWRGTVRYGSLQAHKRQDLGRRDDIECWFYMLVEMIVGELPWRHMTDRQVVGQTKAAIRKETRERFFSRLPRQFETIMGMIDGYSFDIRPEYKHLKALIQEIRSEYQIPERCTWDWQTEESEHSELTETTSVMSDMAIMAEQGATNYTDQQ
uniref:Protein kinase domain-containing protein n=1 Tax=Caenorhabditis japonica TaxID=281687 RepID=A0A8R1HIR2_CAEJA